VKNFTFWIICAAIVAGMVTGVHTISYQNGKAEGEKIAFVKMKSYELQPLKIYYAIDGELDFQVAVEVASAVENFTTELGRALNSARVYDRTGDVELLNARVTGNREIEDLLLRWFREGQKEEAKKVRSFEKSGGLTQPYEGD